MIDSRKLAILLAAAFAASCATDDPLIKRTVAYSKGVATTATPCCKSIAEALGSAAVLTTSKTDFSPEAPHFDFGEGLSPYRAYTLEPTTRALEVHAPLQLTGWAYGGDGRGRHLSVVTRFYGADGAELERQADRRVVKYLGNGYRALFYFVRVPAGARTVVFSTDTRQRDQSATVAMEDMPSTVGVVAGLPVFLPASRSSTFLHANYSPVQFRALQEYPAQATAQ